MKRLLFNVLGLALLVGLTFASCKKEPVNGGKYTVTVVSADEQTGHAYGGGEYEPGTVARIWGTPAVGYKFSRWNDGITDNPRDVKVDSNMVFVASFAKIDNGSDTTGGGTGGGGEIPGPFEASFVLDGVDYPGIALLSWGNAQGLFNLSILAGDNGPIFAAFILPQTGNQTIDDGIQCFYMGDDSSMVQTDRGEYPPYLTVPSVGCRCDVAVTALDITAQTVTVTGSGTMLDIAAAEEGNPVQVPFSFTMDGNFQYPQAPSKARPVVYRR